jgi:hypothetical protein
MFQKQDSNLGTALSTLRSVGKEVDNRLSEYTVELMMVLPHLLNGKE